MFTGGQFICKTVQNKTVSCPEAFSDQQKEFGKAAHDFAIKEILPKKDSIESFSKEITMEIMRSCGEIGFLGIDIPEQYGGLSLDKVTSALVAEKIALGQSESFMVTYTAHTGIGILPIVHFGNEQQKKKYLPKLGSGEWLGAYALTEPGSGSDALSLNSSAKISEDGKYYILNGNKQFISNGGWADIIITFAKIDGEKLTGFLLDPSSKGVILHEEENKMGLHGSSTCNIILENVEIPAENVLGKLGKGAEIALNSLNIGRFKLGAAVLGGCKNVIQESVKYAAERKQFGQPVSKFDAIKKKFADMVIQTYFLESIIYQTAGLLDNSIASVDLKSPGYYRDVANAIEKFAMECSICKIFSSELLWKISDEGLQIFGGYGFIEDYPMARVVRDTRIDRVYEGTNEINRQIIIGYMLKKTLLEELPIRESIRNIPGTGANVFPKFDKDFIGKEKASLETAKYLFLYLYNEALIRFGQDLLNEQQIGELLSDLIINLYVWDTVLARISQTSKESENQDLLKSIATIISIEKSIDFSGITNKIIGGLFDGSKLEKARQKIRNFEEHMTITGSLFTEKRKIAEELYRYGFYPF